MCRPSPHVRFHDDAPQCVRSVVGQIDPFIDLNQLFHGVEHRSSKCQAQRVGEDTQVAAKLAAVICLSSGSGRGKAGDAPSSYSTLVRASDSGHNGHESPWLLVSHRTRERPSVRNAGVNWSGATAAMLADHCQPVLLLYEVQGRDCVIPQGRGRFNIESSSRRQQAPGSQQQPPVSHASERRGNSRHESKSGSTARRGK